jgi:hypothetical protein
MRGELEPRLELGNRLVEHLTMTRVRRSGALRSRVRERKFERTALCEGLTIRRRALGAVGRAAIRLGLLELDVFALEASSHRDLNAGLLQI